VVFNCDQKTLRDFELVHPELDDIVKGLLRSYEGIVDFPTSINETLLAKFVNKTRDYVMQQLTRLQQLGIIEYVRQKESPQITLLLNRMYMDSFVINLENYLQRKQQFEERVQTIIQYVLQTTDCRSKVIAAYFNDSDVKRCGICDNCINLKLTPVSMLDFENIEAHLYALIVERNITVRNLLTNSKKMQQEKLWTVFSYLQAEKKVIVNKDGYLEIV
jgi:ATP-dependent DNA helicase RecQ